MCKMVTQIRCARVMKVNIFTAFRTMLNTQLLDEGLLQLLLRDKAVMLGSTASQLLVVFKGVIKHS